MSPPPTSSSRPTCWTGSTRSSPRAPRSTRSTTPSTDGVTLRLTQAIGGTGDHVHALGVEQHWTLRLLTPEPEPLDVPLKLAHDFQHLVSIAIGHTAQFDTVVLH